MRSTAYKAISKNKKANSVKSRTNNIQDTRIILLLSGGTDSTALLHFYTQRNERVNCIFFNYNQPALKSEKKAASFWAEKLAVELETVKIDFDIAKRDSAYQCRNVLFILIAAAKLKKLPARIAFAVHADSPYYDNTESFLSDTQKILDGYFSGAVQLEAPFSEWSKLDIYKYCLKQNINIEQTYSCENAEKPCNVCPSCLDRERFYVL